MKHTFTLPPQVNGSISLGLKPKREKINLVDHCEDTLMISKMHEAVAHFFAPVAPASKQAKGILNLRIKKLKCIFGNFTNIRKALSKKLQQKKDNDTQSNQAKSNAVVSEICFNESACPVNSHSSKLALQNLEYLNVVNSLQCYGIKMGDLDQILQTSNCMREELPVSQQASLLSHHLDTQKNLNKNSIPEVIDLDRKHRVCVSNSAELADDQSNNYRQPATKPRTKNGRFFRKPTSVEVKDSVLAEATTDTNSTLCETADTPSYNPSSLDSKHANVRTSVICNKDDAIDDDIAKSFLVERRKCEGSLFTRELCRPLGCDHDENILASSIAGSDLSYEDGRNLFSWAQDRIVSELSPSSLGLYFGATPEFSLQGNFWERTEFENTIMALLENHDESRQRDEPDIY
jgi:hypothetical protein